MSSRSSMPLARVDKGLPSSTVRTWMSPQILDANVWSKSVQTRCPHWLTQSMNLGTLLEDRASKQTTSCGTSRPQPKPKPMRSQTRRKSALIIEAVESTHEYTNRDQYLHGLASAT